MTNKKGLKEEEILKINGGGAGSESSYAYYICPNCQNAELINVANFKQQKNVNGSYRCGRCNVSSPARKWSAQ